MVAAITARAALFLAARYSDRCPGCCRCTSSGNGAPNGWQYKTLARVLMPVLRADARSARDLSARIGALLLSRPARNGRSPSRADVRAAAAAAEAVMLIAADLGGVPGLCGVRAGEHVDPRAGGPRRLYTLLRALGVVLTSCVAMRAHRASAVPSRGRSWPSTGASASSTRTPRDPALFVPTRDGTPLDAELRPAGGGRRCWASSSRSASLAPTVILALALR